MEQANHMNLWDRISALRAGTARVFTQFFARPGSELKNIPPDVEADLAALIRIKDDNRNIRDMADTEGWKEYEAALIEDALRKLRALPRKILQRGPDDQEVVSDAAFIEVINTALLGLVTNTLYESANLTRIINTRLAARERLQREEQSNAR